MPRRIRLPVWQCQFCLYTDPNPRTVRWHERRLCAHNPARRACAICRHLLSPDPPRKQCTPADPFSHSHCATWEIIPRLLQLPLFPER